MSSEMPELREQIIILRLGEGLIFFNKDNRANFFGEKNYSEAFQRVYILRIREKL